jgi:hypothetical protein
MNLGISLLLTFINGFGCLTNTSTLYYILKNFDVTVHVFTLVFVDSIISTSCSFVAAIIYSLGMTNIISLDLTNCSVIFFSTFLPLYLGGILTFLVAAIRFILTKKSAQNIQIQNSKVLLLSFATFLACVVLLVAFFVYSLALDIPFIFIVEVCTNRRRPIGTLNSLAARSGILFNIISVVLDIILIKLIRKTVLPGQGNLQTIEGQLEPGKK